jgi:adenosylcobyric acid synthase
LPAEDAFSLRASPAASVTRAGELELKIAVPLLPYISNFDDLDPLRLEPGVSVEMVARGKPLPADAALILLPGSKATIADLEAFRSEGWDIDLASHVRRGGHALGLCGGFQMLGREISDPIGIEGPPQTVAGLGLLDISTALTGEKALRQVKGTAYGAAFEGYEMHMGISSGAGLTRPFLHIDDGRPDGAMSADGRIAGCYVHGLFASDAFRRAWLGTLGASSSPSIAYDALIEQTLDDLAAHLAQHADLDAVLRLMR